MMNPLQRTLIEKVGNDNGFECTLTFNANSVTLASGRHSCQVTITEYANKNLSLRFASGPEALGQELQRAFPALASSEFNIVANDEATLSNLLRRASSLSRALPYHPVTSYQQAVIGELSALQGDFNNTEVERLIRQRVGQQKFRDAMLDYWGGACAVTGVALPAVLRASHTKPWADCASDNERLDVFNGFLLTANFDALFDRFLISFDANGQLLISPKFTTEELNLLGISPFLKLRWFTEEHQTYLAFHRMYFFNQAK